MVRCLWNHWSSLDFISSSFSSLCLCWPSTGIFLNISHLCPVFLPASSCPRRSVLALHTCSSTRLFYLYFLFFFREQLCSSLPLSASLPDYCCLVIFFPFLCQKPLGKSLSASLRRTFSKAASFQVADSKFFSKEFYLFCEKKKRSFIKVSSFSC